MCVCTCPICCQLLPTHTVGNVANGNTSMPVRVVCRLGFVDVTAVADGKNVGESFDLQVFVDLQSTAFSHVIGCGHRQDRLSSLSQNLLIQFVVMVSL